MKKLSTYKTEIINQSKYINEPEWLLAHRLTALKYLEKLNYPEIERLDYSNWDLWKVPTFNNIKNFDNRIENNIRIRTFQDAIKDDEKLFKTIYKQSNFIENRDFFDSFTTAFLTNNIFVYIPDHTESTEIIDLNYILNTSIQKHYNYQVLIYIGKNSSAEIIEKYSSKTDQNQASLNMNIQVIANDGANVQYSILGCLGKNVNAFIRRNGKIHNNARINWSLGTLNDGNVLEDIQVSLEGEGSSSELKVIALSHGRQTQAINARIINKKPNTIGNIFQHGVALNQSTITFNGIGEILRGAKNSDAQQESRVLLLSDEARADTNPILLIDEFEVEAGHAASITRTNEEQLYYLMSRGFSQQEAEKLIIKGFLDIVLAEMPKGIIKEELLKQIERKLSYYVN